eukprot:2835601-Rhodomonas_salina.3
MTGVELSVIRALAQKNEQTMIAAAHALRVGTAREQDRRDAQDLDVDDAADGDVVREVLGVDGMPCRHRRLGHGVFLVPSRHCHRRAPASVASERRRRVRDRRVLDLGVLALQVHERPFPRHAGRTPRVASVRGVAPRVDASELGWELAVGDVARRVADGSAQRSKAAVLLRRVCRLRVTACHPTAQRHDQPSMRSTLNGPIAGAGPTMIMMCVIGQFRRVVRTFRRRSCILALPDRGLWVSIGISTAAF